MEVPKLNLKKMFQLHLNKTIIVANIGQKKLIKTLTERIHITFENSVQKPNRNKDSWYNDSTCA